MTKYRTEEDSTGRWRSCRVYLNISKCFTIDYDGIHTWAISARQNLRRGMPLNNPVRFSGGSSDFSAKVVHYSTQINTFFFRLTSYPKMTLINSPD
jgi:hypothetical protein